MPIEVQSPLAAAANTAASFFAARQEAKKQADEQKRADAAAQVENARKDATLKLEQDKFGEEVNQNKITDANEQAAAVLSAKKEAAAELHQSAEDAINKAKLAFDETKDREAYHLAILKITTAHSDAEAKNKTATDLAQIRANATTGSASISAAARVEAAGISARSAESRLTQSENFTAGQNALYRTPSKSKPAGKSTWSPQSKAEYDRDYKIWQSANQGSLDDPDSPPPDPLDPKYNPGAAVATGAKPPNAGGQPGQPGQFVAGHVYTDAKGNKAKYNADGSWTPQ
jgi:hypothetical protein